MKKFRMGYKQQPEVSASNGEDRWKWYGSNPMTRRLLFYLYLRWEATCGLVGGGTMRGSKKMKKKKRQRFVISSDPPFSIRIDGWLTGVHRWMNIARWGTSEQKRAHGRKYFLAATVHPSNQPSTRKHKKVISAPKRENRTQRNGLDIVKLTHLGARWRSQSISSHLLLVFNFCFLVQNAQQGSSHLVRWFTASSHGRSAYAKAEIESLPHGLIFVRTSSHFCSGAIFSFFFQKFLRLARICFKNLLSLLTTSRSSTTTTTIVDDARDINRR